MKQPQEKNLVGGFIKIADGMHELYSIGGNAMTVKIATEQQLDSLQKKLEKTNMPFAMKRDYAETIHYLGKVVGKFYGAFVVLVDGHNMMADISFDHTTWAPLSHKDRYFTEQDIESTRSVKTINKFKL